MARIDEIIAARRTHRFYDEELRDFASRLNGELLEHLTEDEVQAPLARIHRNIQLLEEAAGPRDDLPSERGWLSPWYWFRLRHWALAERKERDFTPAAPVDVAPMPAIPEFRGIHAGGEKRLARMSRREWMVDALEHGRLRLAPAITYRLIDGDEARTDNEMTKAYRGPGRVISITAPDGQPMTQIGDAIFSTTRAMGDANVETPYWLASYSSDLDPRLFAEVGSPDCNDAALVIFDPIAFLERSLPHPNRAAPRSEKLLHQIEYYDAFRPPSQRLVPLKMRDTRFAYQRERRLIRFPATAKSWPMAAPCSWTSGRSPTSPASTPRTARASPARSPTSSWPHPAKVIQPPRTGND